MMIYKLEVYSDFGQIQLYDESWDEDELVWSSKDSINRICTAPKALGLGVIENDDHILEVRIHKSNPCLEDEQWGHIVDSYLDAESGNLDIAGESITISPGKYIARWSIKVDAQGAGQYQLDLWKGQQDRSVVHKNME